MNAQMYQIPKISVCQALYAQWILNICSCCVRKTFLPRLVMHTWRCEHGACGVPSPLWGPHHRSWRRDLKLLVTDIGCNDRFYILGLN